MSKKQVLEIIDKHIDDLTNYYDRDTVEELNLIRNEIVEKVDDENTEQNEKDEESARS